MNNLKFYCKTLISKIRKFGILSHSGRNFLGRVCVKGRGGGKKKIYRFIDFFRRINKLGKILKILYDCNRTSYIALILYKNGLNSFIIATENLKIFDSVFSGNIYFEASNTEIGWAVPIKNIGLFTTISNIEKNPFKGAIIARSAGTGALLIGKTGQIAILKLNSRWELKVSEICIATIGNNSNSSHKYNIIGSAGKNRGLGFKPKVRGVAKNPCDHPHGGGNGKHSSPPVPRTAFGKIAKWTPTKVKLGEIKNRRLFKKY